MNKKSEKQYTDEISRILRFFEKSCSENIKFSDITAFSKIGENNLKKYFKKVTGVSVMHYFKQYKIEKAKELIKTDSHSFTEISRILGYDSIHYFSRQFKSISGVSPTEYRAKLRKEHQKNEK